MGGIRINEIRIARRLVDLASPLQQVMKESLRLSSLLFDGRFDREELKELESDLDDAETAVMAMRRFNNRLLTEDGIPEEELAALYKAEETITWN